MVTFISFIILFSFTSSCFASYNFFYDLESYSIDLPEDGNTYIAIFHIPNQEYFLCFTSSTPILCYYPETDNHSKVYLRMTNGSVYQVNYKSKVTMEHHNISSTSYYSITSQENVAYLSHNIYDIEANLVFQQAPQIVGQVTIPAIQQVEEIPQVMGEVMKIILPIGLIIFGVFLLILLVRLVISRMT